MSTLGSRAARVVSASIEISMPGVMMPPRYSPALGDRVVGDRGAEVHHHAGILAAVVAGDRVHEPVGAQLTRVVEQDRHSGLGARTHDQRLAIEVAVEQVPVLRHQARDHRRDRLRIDVGELDLAQRRAARAA